MPSSDASARVLACCAAMLGLALVAPLRAQVPVQGFAVERFEPAPPGADYLVMNALSQSGELAGVAALTLGTAHQPLQIHAGNRPALSVISEQTSLNAGFAATYQRLRVYLDFEMPLSAHGDRGERGGFEYSAPSVGLSSHPDLISQALIGADVRVFGAADSALRAGFGIQLYFPNGDRDAYASDDTFHASVRALLAGDLGLFQYAGQLGVHVRPLNEAPIPEAPRGSELLFGLAAGVRLEITPQTSVLIGPELFGQSAFTRFLRASATGVECLGSARLETPIDGERVLGVKLGIGGGLQARFGTPEWRALLGLELSGRATH